MESDEFTRSLSHEEFKNLVQSKRATLITLFERRDFLVGTNRFYFTIWQIGYALLPAILTLILSWRMSSWHYLVALPILILSIFVGQMSKMLLNINLVGLVTFYLVGQWILHGRSTGEWLEVAYPSVRTWVWLTVSWVHFAYSAATKVALDGARERLLADEEFFTQARDSGQIKVSPRAP
jgi:hypothetical protein